MSCEPPITTVSIISRTDASPPAPAIVGGGIEARPGHLQTNLSTSDISGLNTSQLDVNGQAPLDPASQPTGLPFQFKIGRSNPDDAEDVLSVAIPVFTDTFAHTCSPDDMTLYLNSHFTLEHILAELNNPNKRFLIAYPMGSSRSAGFAQLTIGSTEACVDDVPSKVELQRIYVHADQHGSGLGRLLMEAAFMVARSEGYRNVWLGVWEDNDRATRFYEKLGFVRRGTHDFYLGRYVRCLCRGGGATQIKFSLTVQ